MTRMPGADNSSSDGRHGTSIGGLPQLLMAVGAMALEAMVLATMALGLAGAVHADTGGAGLPGSSAGTEPSRPGPMLLAQASKANTSGAQADLDALIKAAKADGEMTFYSSTPESVSKKGAEAFFAKYGVKANYLRFSSNPLLQRYSSEAEANNIAADAIVVLGGAVPFAEEGIKKGWIESISQAGLPVLKSGEFPARFNTGPTALIQISPWLIGYNTEKLKGADVPKDWADLLHPRFKGQMVIPNVRSTDAYTGFWSMILDKYGESYLIKLREQNFRQIGSGIPAVQSVGAGEAMLTLPTIAASVEESRTKGAPLAMVSPDRTTGSESHVILTARAKARHPNAARLFVNWVMTQEGNLAFNKDSGSIAVYDTTGLPKQYESPKPGTPEMRDRLVNLLGFK